MESTSISDPQRSFVVLRCVSDFYIFLVATSRVTAVPSGFGPHPPKSKRSKKSVAENSQKILKNKQQNLNNKMPKTKKKPKSQKLLMSPLRVALKGHWGKGCRASEPGPRPGGQAKGHAESQSQATLCSVRLLLSVPTRGRRLE